MTISRVQDIIRKWYDILKLPNEYTADFCEAVSNIEIPESINIESYDRNDPDGKKNLLACLYMCEALSHRYDQMGIDQNILLDTLSDISIWLNIYSDIKHELYLGEVNWLWRHLDMRLFRLGRLQFEFAKCAHDCPQFDLKMGDPVIAVHIPKGEPLTAEACNDAFGQAREFFVKFYPEYNYQYFTCHSWMLDPVLNDILPPDSNIIAFQRRFQCVAQNQSDAIFRYVFKWDTTPQNLDATHARSSFGKSIKEKYLQGTRFHEGYGIIAK